MLWPFHLANSLTTLGIIKLFRVENPVVPFVLMKSNGKQIICPLFGRPRLLHTILSTPLYNKWCQYQ